MYKETADTVVRSVRTFLGHLKPKCQNVKSNCEICFER